MLFVHGRDFKPAANEVLDLCFSALTAGVRRDHPESVDRLAAVDTRLAYFGDLNNEFLASLGQDYDPALDLGDRRNVLKSLCEIDKRKNFGVHRYDRVPGKTAIAEFAAGIVGPVLGKLGMSNKLIEKACIDLAEYWNKKSEFGDKLRDRVRTALVDAINSCDQLMLISHGTGCVVTYDVLWELSHSNDCAGLIGGKKLDTWVTMGAPLGDSMVSKRLFGASKKGDNRYPTNIVSWYNVSAEDDYLCHDNTLADDFKYMMKRKLVSNIKDYRIYNLAVRYGKSNPHNSMGYLIHPRMAALVSRWLQDLDA